MSKRERMRRKREKQGGRKMTDEQRETNKDKHCKNVQYVFLRFIFTKVSDMFKSTSLFLICVTE